MNLFAAMAAFSAGAALWAWLLTPVAVVRLRTLCHGSSRHGAYSRPTPAIKRRSGVRRGVAAIAIGVVGFLLVEGLTGAVAGVLLATGAFLVLRNRPTPSARREMDHITADLPFAADLMVACLKAGRPLSGAVETVAAAVGGPLGERLAWVGGQLRLGAHPEVAWASLAREEPLARLARTMIRAAETGSPVADALTRLSADATAAARAASSAAARRVGVQTVAPLGLCFLPAFVLLGIVPVIAGLATRVLLP